MDQRRAAGAVRECHGDLHLGNLVRIGGRIVPFDALEFDPALRWIDVMNEVAFLVMDLMVHGRRDLAFRFLNGYLDMTGDWEGLQVLPFYLGYRALVRAKIRALAPAVAAGGNQPGIDQLLAHAGSPLAGIAPVLVLMSGLSGSGKSWIAGQLAPVVPAIHARSDIERKRLFGLGALARTRSAPDAGIYAADASARTYQRLQAIVTSALDAGFPVIVDAANLRREHRARFVAVARNARCPAAIIACNADWTTIEARVHERLAAGRDPSEARMEIVERQREEFEPPLPAEADLVLSVDTRALGDVGPLAARLRSLHVR
jgi:predicted kinase